MTVTSTTKLIDLINYTNDPEKKINQVNVKLGDAHVSDEPGYNSMIPVDGVPGRGYFGHVDIYFDRLLLSDVLGSTPVRSTDSLDADVILKLVNGLFSTFLSMDDLEPFTIPTLAEGETATVTLVAKASAIGFIGQADITIEYGKTWLDSVVSVRVLPAMNHPAKLVGKQSSRMVTWSKDFTCLRDALKVTKLVYGPGGTIVTQADQYTNWDAVQAGCAFMGIPSWLQGGIVDKATRDVPDANPAFHRVVIQSVVISDQLIGPIYLHYNVLEEV